MTFVRMQGPLREMLWCLVVLSAFGSESLRILLSNDCVWARYEEIAGFVDAEIELCVSSEGR